VLGREVVEGPTPARWAARVDNERVLADHDRALVTHDGASLYVAHGAEVVIDAPDPEARLAHDYLVYAYASRLLLLHERRFTLHATLVDLPSGDAVAVTGMSTVGKTTTSVELHRRGWTLVCDDVVEARVRADGVTALPYPRPVHLADDAAGRLGIDPAVGRVLPGRFKRVYSIPPDDRPRRLAGIVRLGLAKVPRVQVEQLSALEALPWLAMHSDPNELCELPEYRADYLQWVGGLVTHVPVLGLTRPQDGDSVEAVVDAVEQWGATL
jgi:hypothetical protein